MQYVKDNSMQDELQTVKLCKIRYHSENSEIVGEVVWSGKSQGHQGQGHQDFPSLSLVSHFECFVTHLII